MIFDPSEIWNYKKLLYKHFNRIKKRPSFDVDDVIQEVWLDLQNKSLEFNDENHIKGFLIKACKYKILSMFYSTKSKSLYRELKTVEDISKETYLIELKQYSLQEISFDLERFNTLIDRQIRIFCNTCKFYKNLKSPGEISFDRPAIKKMLKYDVHNNLTRVNVFGSDRITKGLKTKIANNSNILKNLRSDFRNSQQYRNILLIEKHIL